MFMIDNLYPFVGSFFSYRNINIIKSEGKLSALVSYLLLHQCRQRRRIVTFSYDFFFTVGWGWVGASLASSLSSAARFALPSLVSSRYVLWLCVLGIRRYFR